MTYDNKFPEEGNKKSAYEDESDYHRINYVANENEVIFVVCTNIF